MTTQLAKRRAYGLAASLIAILLTSGCGINQLRTEYAGKIAQSADEAAGSAAIFFKHVEAQRVEANIELAINDPACARLNPRLRKQPDLGGQVGKTGWLCVSTLKGPEWEDGHQLSLVPIGFELEPAFKATEALVAYSDALAEILERPKDTPSKGLLDALELAVAAQDAAAALSARTIDVLPGQDDPRVSATTSLVDFLVELKREADDVKQLRAFVRTQPNGAKPLVDRIERLVLDWDRARNGDASLLLVMTTATSNSVLNKVPPASADDRRSALEKYYASEAMVRSEAKLAPALLAVLKAVEDSDADLRRVLKDNPRLSEDERTQVAQINRERIIVALKRVTALTKALRGG